MKFFNIDRTLVNKNEPVLYYLKDGPKCGFVREDCSDCSDCSSWN